MSTPHFEKAFSQEVADFKNIVKEQGVGVEGGMAKGDRLSGINENMSRTLAAQAQTLIDKLDGYILSGGLTNPKIDSMKRDLEVLRDQLAVGDIVGDDLNRKYKRKEVWAVQMQMESQKMTQLSDYIGKGENFDKSIYKFEGKFGEGAGLIGLKTANQNVEIRPEQIGDKVIFRVDISSKDNKWLRTFIVDSADIPDAVRDIKEDLEIMENSLVINQFSEYMEKEGKFNKPKYKFEGTMGEGAGFIVIETANKHAEISAEEMPGKVMLKVEFYDLDRNSVSIIHEITIDPTDKSKAVQRIKKILE